MNLHFWTFLFQILNFVVVAYVLHRILYRPLHEAIDRRRQATLQAQAEAEQAKRDAEALQTKLQVERAESERQRADLVREAHQQAEAEARRVLDDARRRVQQQEQEWRQQLTRERDDALASVRQEIVGLALGLAERFLKQSASRSLHQQLVARLIESLDAMPADERQQLDGWTTDDPALIETAEELDPQSVENISAALARLVGRQVPIEARLKPTLISGVCLQLAGHIWDASLSGSLQTIGAEDRPEAVHA